MEFKNTEIFNLKGAIKGMRNPMNSWDKSDSGICKGGDDGIGCPNCATQDKCEHSYDKEYKIGKKDMELAQKLIKSGNEHRKFIRQIFVSVDITAPLYWWKEFDTYKVGTTANSTSTMHKLATTPITLNCFEIDDFNNSLECLEIYDSGIKVDNSTIEFEWSTLINLLENLRLKYLETKDKRYWKELIRLLPEAWLQTRTVTMNYENLRNMYFQRRNHKLNEWSGIDDSTKESFCKWINTLPYAEELIMYKGE